MQNDSTNPGCFHCGEPVPAGATFMASVAGSTHAVCCAGCKAVAELIDGSGLQDYYQSRTAFPVSAATSAPATSEDLIYDRPDMQVSFVREAAAGCKETTLLLEGITCSACLWLNERRLQSMDGMVQAQVNYTTRRALIRWDPTRLTLSSILSAVRGLGYRAYPSTAQAQELLNRREDRTSLWRMAVAGLGMMQVMMYAWPAYVADEGSMTRDIDALFRWASLILTLPVLLYSCAPFFSGALRDLRNRTLGMDVPVALGLLVAFVASVVATVTGGGAVYFDSIAMFAFFLLLSRHVERRARRTAAAHLEYMSRALPTRARRLGAYPDSEIEEALPATALLAGDVVSVRAGEAFPGDGIVIRGETEVDESLLTGESRPVYRATGDSVVGGAVNRLSPVLVKVERVGEHTRASHMARLMERAAAERPRIVQLTDRVAAWFVVGVLLIALGTGIGWYFVDPGKVLWTVVAVLVVTCPCALSLATPTVLAVATAAMARRGLVITRAHAIETLANATHFVFDKTGTLTEGRPRLVRVEALADKSAAECLRLAGALETHSEHPIARALLQSGTVAVTDLRNVPGAGVEGLVDGQRLRLGRRGFSGEQESSEAAVDDTSHVWLSSAGRLLARFDLIDTLRPGAGDAVAALRAAGQHVSLYSGDARAVVLHTARSLGIADFRGALLPEGKLAAVRELQAGGHKVVMVGDGVNDAPVLAQAHLSIAMGSGAVLAQAHSDIVLTSTDLNALLDGVRIARQAMRLIRQNLFWALGYNLVAIPLAVGGWLTPWMAGLGMAASSLVVVLNALRVLSRSSNHSADSMPSTPVLSAA